jgi:predicted AAA+ superfamily ATPase
MTKSNIEHVTTGLDILLKELRPYVLRELKARYGANWWNIAVKDALRGTVGLDAKSAKLSEEERFNLLDVQAILGIMGSTWGDVFQTELGYNGRSFVSEIREARNSWAHQRAFNTDDAHRTLDTINRLLTAIGASGQEEVKKISQELLRQQFEIEAKQELKQSAFVTQTGQLRGLKSWRQVATPHPDVASGRYQQTEFAADLALVALGKAEKEYQDPKEFFRRTYLTEGLTELLSLAWERLASAGGDRVVELQTNFGGGKTHSMLALYHLFGGQLKASDIPGIENVIPNSLKKGNVDIPSASRAVLVGTSLSPATTRTKPDGTIIHTLWGELAWQLGESASQKGSEAYALVAEDDSKGVSPGSQKIAELFEKYGPALVLIDEWVAYARQLYNKDGLPAGSFDSNITFVQALTEATKAVPDTLVVASLPASTVEVGGEGGQAALDRISDVFSRLKAVWKPATSSESFEIVRRRLFEPINDYAARDAVCRSFAEMYQANRAEFPPECREVAYEERLKSTYPIHPELFERLYEDWSTIDRFQRTRGVLKLMAAVIHELWERQDGYLLIMPGSVPLYSSATRVNFTDHLGEGWPPVLDKDIDGEQSRPLALDRDNPNFGKFGAARRVARTIFIGSAPTSSAQKVRGLEEVRVKLGCAQPGESIATFGDALRRLSEQLSHLYSENSRYWFDTNPTITRTAADRATQFERRPQMVEDEIIRRVRDLKKKDRGEFTAVHDVPPESSDVPDEMSCRLVILGPKYPHRGRQKDSKAIEAAQDILEHRGNSPRLYKNMLVFLAADADRLPELEQSVRNWLAWTSIDDDKEKLDLTPTIERQVKRQIQNHEDTISERMKETFCHLLIPMQEGTNAIEWQSAKLQGDNIISRASKKLVNDQSMLPNWSAALLRMELDKWLWKEKGHIKVRDVWEYFAQYIYLPRLKDEHTLISAIRDGVGSLTWKDFFAYASAVRDDGYYVGLIAGANPSINLDSASVLVKPDIAQKQREEELAREEKPQYQSGLDGVPANIKEHASGEPVVAPLALITRFHGTVELDPTRMGRDAGRIADEILAHLTSLGGVKARITLEINIEVPNGIPEDRIRIVSENSNTLKFKSHGFEEG